MEDGVEALKIAASMLIFVLAITITISAFTVATQASQRIFDLQSGDDYVKDADGNYINFVNFDGGTREVTVETIVPSMYRAYKENYAIYFYRADGNPWNCIKREDKEVNFIDLEQETYANAEEAIENINILLRDGLYKELKKRTFIEKLGEYYMNDVSGETETAEVNKIKKRVIVYQVYTY